MTRCPAIVGHLCCVYRFGVEDADDDDEPSPPLRLKRAD